MRLVVAQRVNRACDLHGLHGVVKCEAQFLRDAVEIASVGPACALTFPTQHLGVTLKTFFAIAAGQHPVCAKLRTAHAPPAAVSGERAAVAGLASPGSPAP